MIAKLEFKIANGQLYVLTIDSEGYEIDQTSISLRELKRALDAIDDRSIASGQI